MGRDEPVHVPEGAAMKKVMLALSAACLALVAIAATTSILGGADGAQSAGPAPSVAVEAVSAGMPTFELWFIGGSGPACCLVRSTTRTAEELGIPHVGSDFAVGPHLIATLVKALLAGPSPKEAALGFGRPIPIPGADSRLLGVSIENGIVTLDLSSEFRENRGSGFVGLPWLFQLAHVVYTVTQFPEIEGVQFKIEGRPLQVPPGRDPSLGGILPGCAIPEAEELLDRPVTREDYENAVVPTFGVVKSIEPTEQALDQGAERGGDFLEYLITAEFNAPKHLVYKAWTTPELVERWWWSGCGKVTAEIDLKVGGTWRYQMVTDQGDEVVAHGKYREIVPNERIVLTAIYDFHYLEPGRHQQTLNTLTFTEVDGRTTLTILVQAQSKKLPVDLVFGMNGEDELERVAVSLR
jgi:uncharacterized protein YndB with AHSA1/START domain